VYRVALPAGRLIKVFTRRGSEEWLLVHIEIQGYHDKDFGKRLFRYWYRILDKYDKPVTTIAIFTNADKNFNPDAYEYECLGTTNTFRFNTYKIIEQDEAALEHSSNPFAMVVLTVLLALKSKRMTDGDLFNLKFSLAKQLLQHKFSKKKIGDLLIFLQLYVRFADPAYNLNFDKAIEVITKNKKTMGIREMVLERAKKEGLETGLKTGLKRGRLKGREEGLEEGLEKGLEKGKEVKSYEVVKNLIERMGMTDTQVADIAGVSVTFVKKVRKRLKK
jgi:predicted transposase/invertase (TIGR01784 family)